jgi:hypothetical protein
MGNRTARNTGLPGTGVEAIGGEEKMSNDFVNSVDYIAIWITKNPDKAMLRISEELAEAEARGFERGVREAIELGNATAQDYPSPFGLGWEEARSAILALLESALQEQSK